MAASPRGQTPVGSKSDLILKEVRDINRKLEESTRSGANVLIRVARENGDFYENYIGQITNGTYTDAGNLNWKLFSKWVVESMRRAAGQQPVEDEEDTTEFAVVGLGDERQVMDKLGFIRLLIEWKAGTVALPTTPDRHSICIEFESTFLISNRSSPRPPNDADKPLPSIEGNGKGQRRSPSPQRTPLQRGSVPPPARDARKSEENRRHNDILADAHKRLIERLIVRKRLVEASSSPEEVLRNQQDFGDEPDGMDDDHYSDEMVDDGDDVAVVAREAENKEVRSSPSASEIEEGHQDQQLLQELGGNEQADIKRDGDAYWKDKVEAFFMNKDPATGKFTLPGLTSPIENYQAAAIVWLLTRLDEDKVAGCMLADDMGLGKTFTTFATIMAHYYCQSIFYEVQDTWAAQERYFQAERREELRGRHNARNASPGKACPQQAASPYGLQCPCVVGGVARRVVEGMSDLPSIIVVPAQGAQIWVGEWDKFVNQDEGSPAKGLDLYVGINPPLKGKPNLEAFCTDVMAARNADEVYGVYGVINEADEEVEDDTMIRRSKSFKGGSGHILLLTRERTPYIVKMERPFYSRVEYSGLDPHELQYSQRAKTPVAGCAIMVMDEWHTYKGSNGREGNGPFNLLSSFKWQDRPTLAIGSSGNALTIGPAGWRRLLAHTHASIKRHNMKGVKLGRLQTLAQYDKLKEDWEDVQRSTDDPAGTTKRGITASKGRLKRDFVQAINKMMIRRTKEDTFRGQKIVDITNPVMETLALKIPEGTETHKALVGYFHEIQHWARLEHRERMDTWRKGGQLGPAPSLARAERAVLLENNPGGGGNRRGKKSKAQHKRGHDAFIRCLRAVTFPDVVRIAHSEQLKNMRPYFTDSKKLHPIANAFTDATLNPARTPASISAMLRKSPFFSHISALMKGSHKFEALCDRVQKQLLHTRLDSPARAQRRQQGQNETDNPGPPPADGSGVRHMVVFTESPLSAYLTALCLQGRFMDTKSVQVDVLLIHSSLDSRKNSAKNEWNSREAAFKYFSQDCKKTDNNKILVGTYQLISTMHNFQRASSAVLLDVSTPVQRQQAKDRVFRRGQVCTAQITEMYYQNHVFEAHRQQRIKGSQKMEQINWNTFGGVAEERKEGDDDASNFPSALLGETTEAELYD